MQPNSDVLKLSKLGKRLLKQRRYNDAEKAYLEGLDLEPGNSYILVGLGDLYRLSKKFNKAISYYSRLMKQDENNVFALRGIGD